MEGLGSLLLFAVFFFIMMRFGCGSHTSHGHTGRKDETKKHTDPVCGKHVEMDQGYGKMQAGELYRFCTRTCLDKFERNPEQYLNKGIAHNHGGA